MRTSGRDGSGVRLGEYSLNHPRGAFGNRAARLGADVTLIERDGPGGSAVLTDCVPSKTLIATSDLLNEGRSAAELGVDVPTDVHVNLAAANERVLNLAAAQSDDIAERLQVSGVEIIAGVGRLDRTGGVVVTSDAGALRPGRWSPHCHRCAPPCHRRRPARW